MSGKSEEPSPPNSWGAVDDEIELDRSPTPEEEFQALLGPEHRRALDLENRGREQEIALRGKYDERAYGLTQTWVGFIIVITLAQLTLSALGIPRLEPAEFIGVLSSSTVSILGFWAFVGRGLFSTDAKRNSQISQKPRAGSKQQKQ